MRRSRRSRASNNDPRRHERAFAARPPASSLSCGRTLRYSVIRAVGCQGGRPLFLFATSRARPQAMSGFAAVNYNKGEHPASLVHVGAANDRGGLHGPQTQEKARATTSHPRLASGGSLKPKRGGPGKEPHQSTGCDYPSRCPRRKGSNCLGSGTLRRSDLVLRTGLGPRSAQSRSASRCGPRVRTSLSLCRCREASRPGQLASPQRRPAAAHAGQFVPGSSNSIGRSPA